MEAIRVAIAGAGNVAAHLASGIATADGYELVAVASRNPSNAENLGAATTQPADMAIWHRSLPTY